MTKDEILEMLREHKEAKARRAILEADVEEMRRKLEREEQADVVGRTMQGKGFGGVPGGGRISKVVEMAVVRSLDEGPSPMLAQWQDELKSMEAELAGLVSVTDRVDRGMEALTGMELQVIELHELEKVSWRELADRSRRLWGYTMSESTLRNKRRAALEKLAAVMQ